VLLDMENPSSHVPFARRAQSPEFHRLHEHVKEIAFSSSSMGRNEDRLQPLNAESALQ
jgi:hypothetical protein